MPFSGGEVILDFYATFTMPLFDALGFEPQTFHMVESGPLVSLDPTTGAFEFLTSGSTVVPTALGITVGDINNIWFSTNISTPGIISGEWSMGDTPTSSFFISIPEFPDVPAQLAFTSASGTFSIAVPEPPFLALFITGLLGLSSLRRKNHSQNFI